MTNEKAPERIIICIDGYKPAIADWAKDRMKECDIEYVRADLLATVRKEETEAADSERRDILNAIEHSQRLCTHRAQDNSKTGEYRLMMEHFAEAGRQIAEMITEKRYQDLARPINQTEP